MGEIRNNKREANLFEKRIKLDCDLQKIMCTKVPETIRGFFSAGTRRGPRMVKSDPDFILGLDGKHVIFDAKMTMERLWNLKKYVLCPEKIHQFSELLRASHCGCKAGYLVWFKEYRMITWIPIEVIVAAQTNKIPSLTPETEGCISQPEDELIRFRELIL